jgi:hypothetical protein
LFFLACPMLVSLPTSGSRADRSMPNALAWEGSSSRSAHGRFR